MYTMTRLPEAQDLVSHRAVMETIKVYIVQQSTVKRALNILEAGCGRRWQLDLSDIRYTLTGVDLDNNALDNRLIMLLYRKNSP